jgi:hypothetical protein
MICAPTKSLNGRNERKHVRNCPNGCAHVVNQIGRKREKKKGAPEGAPEWGSGRVSGANSHPDIVTITNKGHVRAVRHVTHLLGKAQEVRNDWRTYEQLRRAHDIAEAHATIGLVRFVERLCRRSPERGRK